MLSRRKVIVCSVRTAAVLATGSRAFSGSTFWEKKPASEWSSEEIESLKINSPWAHKVQLEMAGGRAQTMDTAGTRGSFGGMSGADRNGISESRGGARGVSGGSRSVRMPEVIVRWESAPPMLEATKWGKPAAFDTSYAISVTGLPPALLVRAVSGGPPSGDPAETQRNSIQRLLAGTTLSVKGGQGIAAGFVVQSTDHESMYFGFDKKTSPITPDDKEAVFAMNLGAFQLHAKFELKRMMYREELAI